MRVTRYIQINVNPHAQTWSVTYTCGSSHTYQREALHVNVTRYTHMNLKRYIYMWHDTYIWKWNVTYEHLNVHEWHPLRWISSTFTSGKGIWYVSGVYLWERKSLVCNVQGLYLSSFLANHILSVHNLIFPLLLDCCNIIC